MGNLCSLSISTEDTVSRCWDCIVGQARYTCKLEANVKALTAALEELKALRDDLNRKVDLAEQQRMKRLSQVQFWLLTSETVISEAEPLLRDAPQEIEKLCLGGCFSKNCMTSYKFGRQVTSKLEEIAELKRKGVFQRVANHEPVAPVVDVRPTEDTVGLESTLYKVWSLLEQKEVGMIGLYGLGGVGKTTLMTQIYNKLNTAAPSRYDVVSWVVVSKDYTIEYVQAKLGEKLHLSSELWKNKSSDEKAQDIYKILSRKKFFLFLDDLWERVDLTKIGVPLPDEKNGCKVVFTTRLLDVCGAMEAKEKVEVRCLEDIKAWALFQQKVGEETLNSHPDIPELAKMVAEECRGLPLALIVIGRAMTGKKSPGSWEFAIEVLRSSAHKFAKTARELYPILKFSYDNLPSDTMRSCLLYCSLFPEDHRILKSSLIEYWFCEGLLDMFESITKARLQGYHIMDSLVNASLLEQDKDESYVKMHDVIRDMTLWISCECEAVEKRFFVQAGLQLTKAPEIEKWEGVGKVSLMKNQIMSLISTPTCPNLQTLLLNHNDNLQIIEDGCFQCMPKLRVLNLSFCDRLGELPKGISKLVSLECFDLSFTGIRELPIELQSLTKLKCLNLEGTENLLIVPRHLISSFSKLQVFRISNVRTTSSFDLWEKRKVLIGGEDDAVIEELASLQHLKEVLIEMKGVFALERFLSFPNLQECTDNLKLWSFCESKVFNVLDLANMKSLNCLSLFRGKSVEEMKIEKESGEDRIFHNLQFVCLSRCDKLRDMTWLILAPNLMHLRVTDCENMKEIINEQKLAENASQQPFPKLEYLWLESLPELKSICHIALPFLFLKRIHVKNCSNLKKLPLNSDSAKGNKLIIVGNQREWWEELEWEDEATRNAFLSSFMTPLSFYR